MQLSKPDIKNHKRNIMKNIYPGFTQINSQQP